MSVLYFAILVKRFLKELFHRFRRRKAVVVIPEVEVGDVESPFAPLRAEEVLASPDAEGWEEALAAVLPALATPEREFCAAGAALAVALELLPAGQVPGSCIFFFLSKIAKIRILKRNLGDLMKNRRS